MLPDPVIRLYIDPAELDGDMCEKPVVRKQGDALNGYMEVLCPSSFEVRQAAFYLEGVSRNWVSEKMPRLEGVIAAMGERRFLSQAQNVVFPNPAIDLADAVQDQQRRSAPFHFIVAQQLTSSDPDAPDHCLQLPPSLELGAVFIDDKTQKRYAQPSITYQLRAIVELVNDEGTSMSMEISTPIVLKPNTVEYPPTHMEDFPAEFKEKDSKEIRKFLSRSLGTLTISIAEPPALIYGRLSSYASTKGFLKLEFEAVNPSAAYSTLRDTSFVLYSLIRVKTFYTVKPFSGMPSQRLLSERQNTQLQDGIIKLDVQKGRFTWGFRYDMSSTLPLNVFETLEGIQGRPPEVPVSRSPSHINPPSGKWTAFIDVPISVNTRIVPTFCTQLVARLYSVVLRLRISGALCEPFELEVPLQVVHTTDDRLEDMTGIIRRESANAPMRDDRTLVEEWRDPDSAWVSEHLL